MARARTSEEEGKRNGFPPPHSLTVAATRMNNITFRFVPPASTDWTFPAPSVAIDDNTQHEGVFCNNCGTQPIVGVRYKCGNCADYDLCARCEERMASGHAAPHTHDHVFLKLRRPLKANPTALPLVVLLYSREGGNKSAAPSAAFSF